MLIQFQVMDGLKHKVQASRAHVQAVLIYPTLQLDTSIPIQ